jgi:hypothetical protein
MDISYCRLAAISLPASTTIELQNKDRNQDKYRKKTEWLILRSMYGWGRHDF